MKIILGTDPVKVPGDRSRPLIQNLGPGNVFFDTDGDVTPGDGIMLPPSSVYEFPNAGGANIGIYIVADQAETDVRIVVLG